MGEGKNEIRFVWDDVKADINHRKHHISFTTAALVFDDPFRIEIYDIYHSEDENRYITIGMVNDVLFVVYTMRGNAIRLISARLATKEEREAYYEYNSLYS